MKKVFLILSLFFTVTSTFVYANLLKEQTEIVIPEGNIDSSSDGGNPRPKLPARPITIFIDSNEISWMDGNNFCYYQLLDTDNESIVYEDSINPGIYSVTIPAPLTGNYILRIYNGNIWYRGDISID